MNERAAPPVAPPPPPQPRPPPPTPISVTGSDREFLPAALAEDEEFRKRFIRESRAVVAVDHPHIIPVYAAGESGGVLYIAMRFIPGGDLRAVIRKEGREKVMGRARYVDDLSVPDMLHGVTVRSSVPTIISTGLSSSLGSAVAI